MFDRVNWCQYLKIVTSNTRGAQNSQLKNLPTCFYKQVATLSVKLIMRYNTLCLFTIIQNKARTERKNYNKKLEAQS